MSRFSWSLQQALFTRLSADPEVVLLCDGRIIDAPLAEPVDGPVVVIGEESVVPWDTATDRGAEHVVVLTLTGPAAGFAALKALAAAVCAAVEADLALSQGRLVSTRLLKAAARRAGDGMRRIDLRFRIVIEDDAQQGDED